MKQFGLIGKSLSHSFSKRYFSQKFEREELHNCIYELFELSSISQLPDLIGSCPELVGLNVTIPYKTEVIPLLDSIDPLALDIGAVNTIKISSKGKLIGYNTDWIGFSESLKGFISGTSIKRALVLGTGGASKAVSVALKALGIEATQVSRSSSNGVLIYNNINSEIMDAHRLIINCSPVGMYPNINAAPNLPFSLLNNRHFVYDLIYNPEETLLMQEASKRGAKVKNGYEMLVLQAEAAWGIWNS